MLKKIVLIIVTLCPLVAFAYPQYIGKGYHACLTCHYNPFGNGPLNDYGRGVAATALAGRFLVSDDTSNETLSERSGFLFNTPKNKFFRPAFDYRGMQLKRGLETDEPTEKFYHMQMDVNGTFLFGKDQSTIVSITYGVVPSNTLANGKAEYDVEKGEDLWYSREHYVGHRFNQNVGVYLGKMDKVFGIRHVDHTAYSRIKTNNHQHSQTHGAMVHFGGEKFDAGFQYYLGDYEKLEEYRTQGFATKYEHSVLDTLRLGLSYMNETDDNDKNLAATALIYKQQIGKGSSILFEYGSIDETPDGGETTNSTYAFLQNYIYLAKGLYYMMTFEHNNPNTSEKKNLYRIAPGIQWMPVQRVELRADVTNSKVVDTSTSPRDQWSYNLQVHLWF